MASNDLHVTVGAKLRGAHQRYTIKRRTLVDVLDRARQPLAIPQILRDSSLAQSSVYRNLAVLEQAKVVRRVVTGEEDHARYELTEDLTEHHHHLVCSTCGKVQDVTIPPRLEKSMERAIDQVATDTGFATVNHRLDLIGTCRSCG